MSELLFGLLGLSVSAVSIPLTLYLDRRNRKKQDAAEARALEAEKQRRQREEEDRKRAEKRREEDEQRRQEEQWARDAERQRQEAMEERKRIFDGRLAKSSRFNAKKTGWEVEVVENAIYVEITNNTGEPWTKLLIKASSHSNDDWGGLEVARIPALPVGESAKLAHPYSWEDVDFLFIEGGRNDYNHDRIKIPLDPSETMYEYRQGFAA